MANTGSGRISASYMNNMATAAYAIEKTAQKSSPIENQK
jgi:hypothetical protein